jgi:hypothetical protein
MGIEDEIFASALEAQGIKRTQDMYEPSTYPHRCGMCGEYPSHYKLKPQYVEEIGDETPYIYICEECLNELEV